ncbi:S-protein homolog 29-like [Lotus japonicus]|uniref:S-protein homolog 29-like n=1 Tax=Lotus japonicus TaxID=34305 RepID=UPI002587716B|nr:S-protein homolog 29-like [Lotus japonicus]
MSKVTVFCVLVIIASYMLTIPVQGQQGEDGHSLWQYNLVRVENDLDTTLYVHCKSKDDDLGEHYLKPGQYTQWQFRDNFWGTTLFWCNFSWNNVQKRFDVYDFHEDECDLQCYRKIKLDGAYFYGGADKPIWEKRQSW